MGFFERKPGKKLIFRPWYRHAITKKKVYPKKGKFFPMWVDKNEPEKGDIKNDLPDDGDA